jgi:hypothetical protein
MGWGVDPLCIPAYLTSSQGLTINVIGPLRQEPRWAARVLSTVFAIPIVDVLDIAIEYAPRDRSNFLGDMTRIDAVMTTIEESGGRAMIALEFKLADRWSSRYLDPSQERYLRPAETLGTWDVRSDEFRDRRVNQLLRSHLLASLIAKQRRLTGPTRVLLLSLKADHASVSVAAS